MRKNLFAFILFFFTSFPVLSIDEYTPPPVNVYGENTIFEQCPLNPDDLLGIATFDYITGEASEISYPNRFLKTITQSKYSVLSELEVQGALASGAQLVGAVAFYIDFDHNQRFDEQIDHRYMWLFAVPVLFDQYEEPYVFIFFIDVSPSDIDKDKPDYIDHNGLPNCGAFKIYQISEMEA